MSRLKRNRNGKSGGASGSDAGNDPHHDLLIDAQDSALFESFGEYMKGRLDLEEVVNDPSLRAIEDDVREMVSDFRSDRAKHNYDENLIRDSYGVDETDKKTSDEIKNIRFEIHKSNVNDLTAEWVKEWNENRKKSVTSDSKSQEIRDFISGSLETDTVEPEIKPDEKTGKGIKRSLLIRYISLSAAAVIGVFILIRTVLPSSDFEKLYSLYYTPFDFVSSVTRDGAANEHGKYSIAVEKYKLGDYRAAAAGFSDLILSDSSLIASRFSLGITQLAMKNYNQAVIQLSSIANRQGIYSKDASWYLGLTYLKTGKKERAARCFESLAQSSGHYSERSGEILRRLK